MVQDILNALPADYPWREQVVYVPSLDSTNDYLKELAAQGAPHGTAVLADHQTGGHGRRGRSFHSPAGQGIYLSLLLRPDCRPGELMHLTCATGVAVCDAFAQTLGIRPGIKWTNDIVWQRKKLGGILTELRLTKQGTVDYAIIGIGINCCQREMDFPAEIRQIATSVEMATGKNCDRALLVASILAALARMDRGLLTEKASMLAQYRRDCVTIGQEISVVRGEDVRHGKALSVDEEGALVVAYDDGSVQAVNSGEVSIRGMYGYV